MYPYMDIILGLFSVASVFVSFGEGVCDEEARVSSALLCFKNEDSNYPAMAVFTSQEQHRNQQREIYSRACRDLLR